MRRSGHSVIARRNLTRVLQEKVEEGWFSEEEALAYAQCVMHDYAPALYAQAAEPAATSEVSRTPA